MSDKQTNNERERPLPLWDGVLGLLEQNLVERRDTKLLVEVPGEESEPCQKEIGELCASERRGLPPALGEHVAERLLDRYLAEQGYIDLVEGRRPYTKKIEDLTPADLPALVEADQLRAEEERLRERERAELVRDVRADLDRLRVVPGLAGMSKTGKEARR